jgi:glycosyltransferase involved in cell wall biosynthesis
MERIGKKLLIISEVFYPEEFLINDLAENWQKNGIEVHVLTRNPSYPIGKIYSGYKNKLFQNETYKGIYIHRVQFIPGYKNNIILKAINYIWNMLLGFLWVVANKNKYNLVFIYHTGSLTFASLGIFFKVFNRSKVIIWSQDIWPNGVFAYGIKEIRLLKYFLVAFVKWTYSKCDQIIVSCPGFINVLKNYMPDTNIVYIPQWSTITEFINTKIELDGDFNFAFAGNIGSVQNIENVIKGFDLYLKKSNKSNVFLNIIGDASYLNGFIKENQTIQFENIRFHGRHPSKDMFSFFKKSDVLLLSLIDTPITNLTIPAKFQAYLCAEKPILGIIKGEVASLIIDNNIGWNCSPSNVIEISEIFQVILESSKKSFQGKIKNCKELLENNFNRENNISNISHIVFGK